MTKLRQMMIIMIRTMMILPAVSYGAVGTTPISQPMGYALGVLAASPGAPLLITTINATITALPSQEARNRQLYNLAPELNGAITQLSELAFMRGMSRVTHRYDEFTMPISARTAIWMQGQGHWAKQTEKGEFAGYHADASGIKIGIDHRFAKQNIVGADMSFLSLSVDPRNFSTTEHDIDSYQIDLYGNYDLDTLPIYVEGNISTASSQYHTRRNIISGGERRDSKSSYHGWQAGARAEIGYMMGNEKIKFMPVLGASYIHSNVDSYRETSADSLNLHVKLDHTNLWRSTLGVRSIYEGGVYGNVTVMPEVYALWAHDFHVDHQGAEVNFIVGGPKFRLAGLKPAKDALEAGFKITLYNGHGFNYSTNYHYEVRHNYHTHSAWLKMRYEWV